MDVYLRGSGEFIYRLLPSSIRDRVKKIELAIVRGKYKPLRPAASTALARPAGGRHEMPGFRLTTGMQVWVVVTERYAAERPQSIRR